MSEIMQEKTSKSLKHLHTFWGSVSAFATKPKDDRTNIIDQGTKKTYALPDDEISKLMEILNECQKEGVMSHVSEKQGVESCMMIDFDIIQTVSDSLVTTLEFQKLTKTITDMLFEFIEFERSAKFTIGIIKKKKPVLWSTDPAITYKDGFHVLITTKVTKPFKKFFQRQLIERDMLAKIFGHIPVVGDINDILDTNSASVPVLFLGSSKKGKESYDLAYVWQASKNDDFDLSNELKIENYVKHNMVYELSINFQPIPILQEDKTTVYPLCMKRAYPINPAIEEKLQQFSHVIQQEETNEDEIMEDSISISSIAVQNPDVNNIKEALDMLDSKYASDRNLWRNVIFALASMGSDGKELARWFSKKCPEKYSHETFEELWDYARSNGSKSGCLTKASIFFWAQESNPDRFKELKEKSYFNILGNFVYQYDGQVENYMVAKLLQSMIGNKFITDCGSGSKHEWYEFVLPGDSMRKGEIYKWRSEVSPDDIQLYMSECLPKIYQRLALHLSDRRESATEKAQVDYLNNLIRSFKISTRFLFQEGFKNNVVSQAKYIFRKRGFSRKLDKHADLFGVGNGVLKLGKKCKLIDYFHEYEISKFTEVDFEPFDPDDPKIQQLLDIIRDIIPEEDAFEFIMMYLSTGLSGGTKAALMLFLIGGGSNGKSFILELLRCVMGDMYGKKLPLTLLTEKREASEKANPAFMLLKEARYGYYSEPNQTEEINVGRFKEGTGGEALTGRGLFKDQDTFKPSITQVSAANYDFIVRSMDHGFWRRFIKYACKIRFVENPDPHNPFEKKIDRDLIDRHTDDPIYLRAFLSILTHYYEKLQNNFGGDIFKVPKPTLDRETEAFRNESDTMNRFIKEEIIYSKGAKTNISDISTRYAEWFEINIKKDSKVDPKELISQLKVSAIRKFMVDNGSGGCHMVDHRVLTKRAPDLQEGELFFRDVKPKGDEKGSGEKEGYEKNGVKKEKKETELDENQLGEELTDLKKWEHTQEDSDDYFKMDMVDSSSTDESDDEPGEDHDDNIAV
jgi:phage/plasmid-associated DNA primase